MLLFWDISKRNNGVLIWDGAKISFRKKHFLNKEIATREILRVLGKQKSKRGVFAIYPSKMQTKAVKIKRKRKQVERNEWKK